MRLIDAADGEAFHDALVRTLHGGRIGGIERAFVLIDHDAVLAQGIIAAAVEFLCEQALTGSERVRGVHDDEVVFVLAGADEFQSVCNMDMHARVVEAAGRLRQILAADLDDQLVDLDEVDALRRLITRQLAHDAAVTRADDKDILGIRVDGHGDVRDHLMIDELVLLRQHHIAVKRQEAAEFPRLEHVDPLEFALRRIELALDLDGKIHIRRMPLRKPKLHCLTPLSARSGIRCAGPPGRSGCSPWPWHR